MFKVEMECNNKRAKQLLGGLAAGALLYVGYKTGFNVSNHQIKKGLEEVFEHCPEFKEQMLNAVLKTKKDIMMK